MEMRSNNEIAENISNYAKNAKKEDYFLFLFFPLSLWVWIGECSSGRILRKLITWEK